MKPKYIWNNFFKNYAIDVDKNLVKYSQQINWHNILRFKQSDLKYLQNFMYSYENFLLF